MFYSCKFLLQVTFERKLFSLVLVRFALTNRCSPVSCLLKVLVVGMYCMSLFFRSAAFDASKCEEMLAQGKRNLLCGEVPQSVNQLQEVCRLLYACIYY